MTDELVEVKSKPIPTYMPRKPSEQQVQDAQKLTEDEQIISDNSGMSNKDKWETVQRVFNAPQATMFAKLSYAEVYDNDEPRTAEAAYYLADLRKQYLARLLSEEPGDDFEYLHSAYRENLVWLVRLRERARLSAFCEAARRVSKPN